MAHSRYFEIQLDDVNLNDILDICVETQESIIPSIDNTKTIVKLFQSSHS